MGLPSGQCDGRGEVERDELSGSANAVPLKGSKAAIAADAAGTLGRYGGPHRLAKPSAWVQGPPKWTWQAEMVNTKTEVPARLTKGSNTLLKYIAELLEQDSDHEDIAQQLKTMAAQTREKEGLRAKRERVNSLCDKSPIAGKAPDEAECVVAGQGADQEGKGGAQREEGTVVEDKKRSTPRPSRAWARGRGGGQAIRRWRRQGGGPDAAGGTGTGRSEEDEQEEQGEAERAGGDCKARGGGVGGGAELAAQMVAAGGESPATTKARSSPTANRRVSDNMDQD